MLLTRQKRLIFWNKKNEMPILMTFPNLKKNEQLEKENEELKKHIENYQKELQEANAKLQILITIKAKKDIEFKSAIEQITNDVTAAKKELEDEKLKVIEKDKKNREIAKELDMSNSDRKNLLSQMNDEKQKATNLEKNN